MRKQNKQTSINEDKGRQTKEQIIKERQTTTKEDKYICLEGI